MRQVYVFEAEDIETSEVSQEFFLKYFRDAKGRSAEFFAIGPGLSNGKVIARLKCFQYQDSVYVLAEARMSRTLIEHLLDTVRKKEAKKIFIAVLRDLPNFWNVFKTLAFIGFVQVDPKVQRTMCVAPAVLMQLNISSV